MKHLFILCLGMSALFATTHAVAVEPRLSTIQGHQGQSGPTGSTHVGESDVILPVFVLGGAGNAHGLPGETPLNQPPPGSHPAEKEGGIWFFDGDEWGTLATGGGPEVAFGRLLWDAGFRDFGIVKSTTTEGGNSLWHKGSDDDFFYQELYSTATAAASGPPHGVDSIEFRALLFVQGEKNDDDEADVADERFTDLLENLRTDLPGAQDLHGVLGEIGGSGATRDTTRARHAALAAARPDIGFAARVGLATHDGEGLAIHYTADSIHMLGARMAAEAMRMGLPGERPLPAWNDLHAWYVADHGALHDDAGAVTRWAALHDGQGARDLSRRVAGQVFRRPVSAHDGVRHVLRFDGTNDLWANASNEFGAIAGPRTVAVLCRVTDDGDGFLFDGSTNTGRTRAQVRGGMWQAGVTPAGASISWNLAEPETVARQPGWQRHVFTYLPNEDNTATTIEHWVDGTLAATASEDEVAALGGLIVGGNGGSPFSRLAVDVAEIAVYAKTLDAAEIAGLDAAWEAAWGDPGAPPLAARVRLTAAEVPRFGWHSVLEIEIDSPGDDLHTLAGLDLELRESTPGTADRWRLLPGPRFNPSAAPLAEIAGGAVQWSPDISLPLEEGTQTVFLAVEPARHAALGSTLDAALDGIEVTGAAEPVLPANPDPPGELVLALVPMFTDVVRSGDLGIHTFRIPGIVTDSEGVLHAVYDHRYNNSGDLPGHIDVGYSRSTDGGATWSGSRVIMAFDPTVPGSQGNGVGDPAILYDPATGALWVAALWSFGNNAYHGSGPGLDPDETGQYVLAKSTDGGDTWSNPINITAQVKDPAWRLLFVGPGHGIALRDGTLVFPSQMRREDGLVRMCFVFSRDQGESWQFGSVIPQTSPQTNENELLELDDGRLLFSGRTPVGSNGQRAWAYYTPAEPGPDIDPLRDGSWSEIFRLPSVPDPVCQASVIQWKSTHDGHPREWLLFANPATGGRNGMTIRLSQDAGQSWPLSRLLYPGSSAYSCLTILPDGSIGLFFERDNYSKITFARVEEGWLLNYDLDSDGDGMPDAWEILHGLDPDDPSDAAIDSDGDGATNLEEFIAGTDPQNPDSRFRTTMAVREADEGDERFVIRFDAIPCRFYAIEASADLVSWDTIDVLAADGPEMEIGIELPPDDLQRFFRIRTGL